MISRRYDPAFSVVKKGGGATFVIYPRGDLAAMQQVGLIRQDGRVDMYAKADYSAGTTANMWTTNRIRMIADRIRNEERARIERAASAVPRHLVGYCGWQNLTGRHADSLNL